MAENRPDGVPDDMPIPNVPIHWQIIADVAEEHDINVTWLAESLEEIHDHVAERARDLTERYTEELGDEALVFQADIQQFLYVDADEWAEIGDQLALDEAVISAAKAVHDDQCSRIVESVDEAEWVPRLETNDMLVMATPPIQDWREAGLSLRQALVQTLRTKGDTQERIGQKMGIATGTVKSYCSRIDRKIAQARQLVTLADR